LVLFPFVQLSLKLQTRINDPFGQVATPEGTMGTDSLNIAMLEATLKWLLVSNIQQRWLPTG
jgi:hypothetical protein